MPKQDLPSLDRRVVRTQKAIHKAIYELIQEKHSLKLTVSEVAQRADINRKTFYAHYDTLEDALRKVVDEEITHLCAQMLAETDKGSAYELQRLTLIFLELIDSSDLIGNAPHQGDDLMKVLGMVRAPIKRIVLEQNYMNLQLAEGRLDLAISLYLSNLVVAYYEWRNDALPLTKSELADLITSYTLNGVGSSLASK